jgi:hypothetical protein
MRKREGNSTEFQGHEKKERKRDLVKGRKKHTLRCIATNRKEKEDGQSEGVRFNKGRAHSPRDVLQQRG